MNTREFIVFIYFLNFLIGILSIGYFLITSNYIDLWQLAFYGYYFILGFCGVALAYWISEDKKDIIYYADEIQKLRGFIQDLKKQKTQH